ncbi:MAG: DUF433 domain-containing protein [Candidatus Zixiibacteriota bacterium]
MDNGITIRNTGISLTDVLKLMAQGLTYGQIVKQYPSLIISDLMACAKTAADLIERYIIPQGPIQVCGEVRVAARDGRFQSLEELRKKHPRAFERWTEAEEKKLVELYRGGQRIGDIARVMQRLPGGIRARLVRLGLIEDTNQPTPAQRAPVG